MCIRDSSYTTQSTQAYFSAGNFSTFTTSGLTNTGGVTLSSGGTISPGTTISLNSSSNYTPPTATTNGKGNIGTLTMGTLTLNGGTYYVDMNATSGTQGQNWDFIQVLGAITNTAGATVSLNGSINSFSNSTAYTWKIGSFTGTAPTTSSITVSASSLSLYSDAGVTSTTATGTWTISFTANANLAEPCFVILPAPNK